MTDSIRVNAFLKLSAMELIVQIAGLPLVSALMTISSWYVLGISSILLVVAGSIAYMLPEMHPKHEEPISGSPDSRREEVSASQRNEVIQRTGSHLQVTRELMVRSYATLRDYSSNVNVVLSLAVFLLAACGAHTWALLLQYVSQKFNWEFSTVSLDPGPLLETVQY